MQQYIEANTYLRHYSSLRYVIFSVYFAVMAGVVSVAFNAIGEVQYNRVILCLVFRILGLLLTIPFFIYELRLEKLIRYYQYSAMEMERCRGFNLMNRRPRNDYIFWATKSIYILFIIFWLLSILAAIAYLFNTYKHNLWYFC
jgi:hypothetical protein